MRKPNLEKKIWDTLWLLIAIIGAFLIWFPNMAHADTSTLPLENAGFTIANASDGAEGWSGNGTWYDDGTSGPCPLRDGPYVSFGNFGSITSAYVEIPEPYRVAGSTIIINYDLMSTRTATNLTHRRWFNYKVEGSSTGTNTSADTTDTGQLSDGWVRFDNSTYAPHSYEFPVDDISEVRLQFQNYSNETCMDNILFVITNPAVDCDNGGCTDVNDEGTDEGTGSPTAQTWSLDSIGGDDGIGDALDTASDLLDAFQCGDVTSFVSSKIGGGGFLKRLFKAVLNIAKSQLKLNLAANETNCRLATGNEIANENYQVNQDIFGAVSQSQGTPTAPSYPATIWDTSTTTATTATDSRLSTLESGIDGDDLVTAQARSNRIMIASMRQQAAMNDRLIGTRTRSSYERERGPLMTQSDVDANSGADFAEGDYAGTASGLIERAQDAEPDYEELADLEGADTAATGTGACLSASMTAPTGEGTELAFATLKWNAGQRLAKSNLGNFICSIIDQPARSVQDICIGPPEGFLTATASAGVSLPNSQLCVYGPEAPSFSNWLFNSLSLILLMFASLSVFKMFFN